MELRAGTLPERERAKYFLVFMTALAAGTELVLDDPEPTSPAMIATSVLNVASTAVGLYLVYRANRAGDDKDFVVRCICLTFPVGVRIIVCAIAIRVCYAIFGLVVGGESFDAFTEQTNWFDVLFYGVVALAFYWRLWHHIIWISRPQNPS